MSAAAVPGFLQGKTGIVSLIGVIAAIAAPQLGVSSTNLETEAFAALGALEPVLVPLLAAAGFGGVLGAKRKHDRAKKEVPKEAVEEIARAREQVPSHAISRADADAAIGAARKEIPPDAIPKDKAQRIVGEALRKQKAKLLSAPPSLPRMDLYEARAAGVIRDMQKGIESGKVTAADALEALRRDVGHDTSGYAHGTAALREDPDDVRIQRAIDRTLLDKVRPRFKNPETLCNLPIDKDGSLYARRRSRELIIHVPSATGDIRGRIDADAGDGETLQVRHRDTPGPIAFDLTDTAIDSGRYAVHVSCGSDAPGSSSMTLALRVG